MSDESGEEPDGDSAEAAAEKAQGIEPGKVVKGLYHALLGRAPNVKDLRKHVRALRRGVPPQAVIKEILSKREMQVGFRDFAERNGITKPGYMLLDYSQFGELQILLQRMLARIHPHRCVVVDVGARGRKLSNSYDLMRTFGWRGVLIEANPALRAEIERDFAGVDFKLVQCAIGDYEGKATFTIAVDNSVSSLLADRAASWGPTRGEVEVDVRRLHAVLEENKVPETFELLSIDIEGLDVKVVNDLIDNSLYRPTWIVIEVRSAWSVQDLAAAGFSEAVQREYDIAGRTLPNLILERRAP